VFQWFSWAGVPSFDEWHAEQVTALAQSVAAIGILFVLLAALWTRSQVQQLKSQVRIMDITRQASVMIELSNSWREAGIAAIRSKVSNYKPEQLAKKVMKARASKWTWRRKKSVVLMAETDFYEDLAVLVKNGAVDTKLIRDSYRLILIEQWDKWYPTIQALRDEARRLRLADPDSIYEHFEVLARAMRENP
jgi:Domain of unknown function (DUF4760)